jgi:UDP-N-acetylmuramoyl-L-alanyl-D-glutamate--2,6-diaminopimelate ligase
LKTLSELLPSNQVRHSGVSGSTPISAIVQGTDQVIPGALFFAVRGSRSDGHAFVEQALAAGAAAAVVETSEAQQLNPRTLLVDSTRKALGHAASRWHDEPTRGLKLVGVTGTNGKTTTSFLLDGIWRSMGYRTGVVGTVEYRVAGQVLEAPLTTPDALTLQALFSRMRDAQVSHACIEVSSIALDQDRVAGCQFEVGLFTNFTPDHLDYHGTMEVYLAAKQRLFSDYAPRVSVFNADDPAWKSLRNGCRSPQALTYSTASSGADFAVRSKQLSANGIAAQIETPHGLVRLRSPLLGMHNLSNCLGVLACEVALGGDAQRAVDALCTNPGAPGRLERVAEGVERPYIFVDYAHTEDALRNVLESLNQVRGEGRGRILTVFGCGGDRDRGKRPRMAAVAASLSDCVIATSDNPRTEDPEKILDEVVAGIPADKKFQRDADRRVAIGLALQMAKPGDFVLVAGKGHETYQVLGLEKVPFDDREVIRDYYGYTTGKK